MLDGWARVGTCGQSVEKHEFSFTCIYEQLEATEGDLYGIEARLEVSIQHSVQRRARSIQNGVVCVEVDQ
jgi:hypothetical protein